MDLQAAFFAAMVSTSKCWRDLIESADLSSMGLRLRLAVVLGKFETQYDK